MVAAWAHAVTRTNHDCIGAGRFTCGDQYWVKCPACLWEASQLVRYLLMLTRVRVDRLKKYTWLRRCPDTIWGCDTSAVHRELLVALTAACLGSDEVVSGQTTVSVGGSYLDDGVVWRGGQTEEPGGRSSPGPRSGVSILVVTSRNSSRRRRGRLGLLSWLQTKMGCDDWCSRPIYSVKWLGVVLEESYTLRQNTHDWQRVYLRYLRCL